MANWLSRQYDDVRGNLKWGVLMFMWWLLTTFGKKLLGLIPSIPEWLIYTVLCLLSLGVFLWIAKVIGQSQQRETGHGTVAQVDQTDWKKLFAEEKKVRNEFQEKYAEAANKVLELQFALSQPPTPRSKVISLCDSLRSFLSKYGPIPCVTRNANEQLDDYFQRKCREEDTWKSRMAADFRLNFEEGRIEKLCDEIQLVSGLTSSRINTLILSARSPLCDPNTVENIRTELWTLAGGMTSS